jgi:hypothetical protein
MTYDIHEYQSPPCLKSGIHLPHKFIYEKAIVNAMINVERSKVANEPV